MRGFPGSAFPPLVPFPPPTLLPVLVGLLAGAGTLLPLRADPVTFPVPRQTGFAGESLVVPFRVEPAATRRTFPLTIDPPGAVEVLQDPVALDGEGLGFLRVRPRLPGAVTLRVGDAPLALRVVPGATGDALSPVIVSPVEGARVWGSIGVGVEVAASTDPRERPRVALRLPNGAELPPTAVEASGANWSFAFECDVDVLPPGPARLLAVRRTPHGREVIGEPLVVEVVRPAAGAVVSGHCAEVKGARPERFGDRPPRITSADFAPGGRFVDNGAPDPAWSLPLAAPADGYYQLVLTARGTSAAGAFPAIGLFLDEAERPSTAVRVVDRAWLRLPVGRPVRLSPASRALTPYFLNDFSPGSGLDRNLGLARYELLRVADARPGDKPGDSLDDSAPAAVAFRESLNGLTVQGPFTVRAVATGRAPDRAPRVELLINGRPQPAQVGLDPRFEVAPGALRPGENTLQLRATPAFGDPVLSPVQRVTRAEGAAGADRPFRRFTALDPAWETTARARRVLDGEWALAFPQNGEARFALPAELSGRQLIAVEARGVGFRGPATVEVALREGTKPPRVLATAPVDGVRTVEVGEVNFGPGVKELLVRFPNDLYEPEDKEKGRPGGDRNLWVRAVTLRGVEAQPPAPGPLRVLYPRAGADVGPADAVVVEGLAAAGWTSLDLTIDGKAQRLSAPASPGLGPVLLPLLTRGLSPGAHKFRVTAVDAKNRRVESVEQTFVVRPTASAASPYRRAVRLLDRFGFGPEPAELAAILTQGEEPWLRARLADDQAWRGADDLAAIRFPGRDAGPVASRALLRGLITANPVRERLVLWVDNHFSTWIQKAGAANQWEQHARFSALGAAPFRRLLAASATSPAMLIYLDQRGSFVGRLNENYARELMELHTLGVDGGYRQTDVTALAQHLNGWTVADVTDVSGGEGAPQATFRFEPRLNDGRARRIFGMEFPATTPAERYDAIAQALDLLAAHPSTARFIARKLAEHYAGTPAPARLVDDLARVYLETGGDLTEMLVAIARHPDFWSAPPRVATPLDFGLRLSRLTAARDPDALRGFLSRSGMGLFERPSPDGYPEADDNYMNSNVLMQRWRFVRALPLDPDALVPTGWLVREHGVIPRADWQRALDLVAVRLTGDVLSEASNRAALEFCVNPRREPMNPARAVALLVAQAPELSLR